MKQILVVSHCILNTAAKVRMDEGELAEEYRVKGEFLKAVLDHNIQLVQLPCPEFQLYGSRRWGHVSEQFHHPHFLKSCEEMLTPICMQMQEYMQYPEEYRILGIVSVEGSPSCGYHLTCSGNWGAELCGDMEDLRARVDTCHPTDGPGVLMEVLEKMLKEQALSVPIVSMPEALAILNNLSL